MGLGEDMLGLGDLKITGVPSEPILHLIKEWYWAAITPT